MKSTKRYTRQELAEFEAYCKQVTVQQLHNVIAKERDARRMACVSIAEKVLQERTK